MNKYQEAMDYYWRLYNKGNLYGDTSKEWLEVLQELVDKTDSFEEKQETNLDHYFEDLLKTGGRYAFVNGKIKHCWDTRCCNCAFKGGNCHGEKIKWLASPYEKQTYKLTQFEYDLLQCYSRVHKFIMINSLVMLKEKGYFKDVDENAKIEDILANCEVIK